MKLSQDKISTYRTVKRSIHRLSNWLFFSQKGNLFILIGLFSISICSKIPGFANELPPYVFCDEAMWSGTVERALAAGTLDIDEFRAGGLNVYPVLYPLLAIKDWFHYSLNETQTILLGRFLLTGVLGSSTVFFIYGIAKEITRHRVTGLVAAMLFVISPFTFAVSQYWYPDHYIYFFSAGFLYFYIRTLNSEHSWSLWNWLCLGVFAGLATSVKYTGILLMVIVPVLLVIQFFNWKKAKKKIHGSVQKVFINVFFVFFGFVFSILVFNWSAFFHPETFLWGFEFNQSNYSHTSLNWAGVPFYLSTSFLLTLPPLGVLFFIAGYLELFRLNRPTFYVMICFPIGLILFLGTALTILNRNMSLLFPFLFPIAAIGIVKILKSAFAWSLRLKILVLILVFGSLLGTTYLTLIGYINDFSGDSRVAASQWIDKNIPEDEVVGVNWSCAGPNPASTAGLATVEDGMMEKDLNVYVLDSYWTPSYLSPAYRSIGLLQNPLQKYVHFYNSFSDSRLLNLSSDIPSVENLAELKGYVVVKSFSNAGPQIVVLVKANNSIIK